LTEPFSTVFLTTCVEFVAKASSNGGELSNADRAWM